MLWKACDISIVFLFFFLILLQASHGLAGLLSPSCYFSWSPGAFRAFAEEMVLVANWYDFLENNLVSKQFSAYAYVVCSIILKSTLCLVLLSICYDFAVSNIILRSIYV